jgi:carboxyl-terminal processing protease
MKFTLSKKTVFILILGIIFLLFSFTSKFFEVAKQIEIYNTLFKELNMYYIDEINPAELTNKAIKNTLKGLDPYTVFYDEQEVEDARIRKEGEYGGIGVSTYYSKKGIQINEIYKGYSADRAGLKAGDLIISIDGQSVQNMERGQLSLFLKGIPNSRFTLQLMRQGEVIKKEISRDKIIMKAVPFAEMIDSETGYIALTGFNSRASSEVKKAFQKLKNQGMQRLVFDLRSNPGGSLFESINIANFFLPKGEVIVKTKAKVKKWSTTYKASNKPLDLEIPIVVLVNKRSASASEIVSGALQDYDRAVIMGERSFGKGLVQSYRKLTYGTQLKLTISKYYTPSGRCIQELDYANRDAKGTIPKFSEQGINEFKTSNGRIVYDGGGILPDIKMKRSESTEATKTLVKSRAIFNYATNYYYQNPSIAMGIDFDFKEVDFKRFIKYIQSDTTFITKQESLFKGAYNSLSTKNIVTEYKGIKEKLLKNKIADISKNKDILKKILKEEILKRYYYQEGVYLHNLKNDTVIKEAVLLLQNQERYRRLLSAK